MGYKIFNSGYDKVVKASCILSSMTEDSVSMIEESLIAWKPEQVVQCSGETPLTFLIDCSGSVRGAKMAATVSALRAIGDRLSEVGRPFEILGFTTTDWKGGKPKKDWIDQGQPKKPGRLNSLLHVVIHAFEDEWASSRKDIIGLFKEGLCKENIDGEALLWAHARAKEAKRDSRIIIISDGFPVDYATDAHNEEGFLQDHLAAVINEITMDDAEVYSIQIYVQPREVQRPIAAVWPSGTKVLCATANEFDAHRQNASTDRMVDAILGAIATLDHEIQPEPLPT